MKKVTMIFAAVVMFAVVSCGSKTTTEEVVVTDSVAVVEADTSSVSEEVELDSSVKDEAIQ
jgi:uncharacterized protein YcfL